MSDQKIVPYLWFDQGAVEAATLYTSIFPDSVITHHSVIKDTPSGDCDIVGFTVCDYQFMSISAGPYFKINPSISFHVKLAAAEQIDTIWAALTDGGQVMMPLGDYPFNRYFGWVQDRYGVNWQLMIADDTGSAAVVPAFLFTQVGAGRAEEAMNSYAAAFADGAVRVMDRFGAGEGPDQEGTVRYGEMTLAGQTFAALDSAHAHDFVFNEAVSLMVNCDGQAEIDHFWGHLSAVPEAEQCGWLKDKFGVSWQIVPDNMEELMALDPEKTTPAMLAMKKIIIDDLIQAAASA